MERLELLAGGGAVHRLSPLQPVGFDEGEEVLPQPEHAHPAYGLLLEYFAFPRKFQFFDVKGLRGRLGQGRSFSLRIVFDRSARVLSLLTPDNFLLGCSPAVNLFVLTGEPIRLDRKHYEYLLVPDYQRESTTEVHSVLSVTASDPRDDRPVRIPSVFSEPDEDEEQPNLFWTARREGSLRKDIMGTDVFLGFVDRHAVQLMPDQLVVYAQLLCTNRRLAEQLPPGARFFAEGVSSSTRVRALYQPSAQREPVMGARALWAL